MHMPPRQSTTHAEAGIREIVSGRYRCIITGGIIYLAFTLEIADAHTVEDSVDCDEDVAISLVYIMIYMLPA